VNDEYCTQLCFIAFTNLSTVSTALELYAIVSQHAIRRS